MEKYFGNHTVELPYKQERNKPQIWSLTKDTYLIDEINIITRLSFCYFQLEDYDKLLENLTNAVEVRRIINQQEYLKLINQQVVQITQSSLTNYLELWRQNLIDDPDKIAALEKGQPFFQKLAEHLVELGAKIEALLVSESARARAFADLLASRLSSQSALKATVNLPTIPKIKRFAQEKNLTIVEYLVLQEKSKIFIWLVKANGETTFKSVDFKFIEAQGTFLSKLVMQARKSLGIEEPEEKVLDAANSQPTSINIGRCAELQQLYRLLISPIVSFLPTDPNTPVLFIPQGSLFLLPFAALQDEEGKFLIEKHTIVTAPSIQVLELTQKSSTQVPKNSLDALVVGNPKMPTTIPLTPLPWAKKEAQAIAPLLNTQAITGVDATKAYITKQMPKARLIHLATHGYYGLLNDIRQLGIPGAIAFAPSDEDNGFLTAGEIYDMKLNAELVVLSACRTGRGKIRGDGVIGLSRCLILAGVKSVIVSLWSVGDLSTALLMVKFYQIFQQGVAATIALNEAQRWLSGVTKTELEVWLKTNERFFDATLKINLRRRLHQLDDNAQLFQHPQYWAAFCAIGQ